MSALAVFHAVVAPVLTVLALHTLVNDRRWPRLEGGPPPTPAPSVSVLIPARNEQSRIAECIGSWTRQEYPDYEMLVYDDESTDETAACVLAASPRGGRVRLIRGSVVPPGWRGKPHACDRLRAQACGRILVFADADVRGAPGTLAATARALSTLGADALSAVPAHRGGSAGVRLLVGIQNWAPLAFLPLWLPAAARHPLFAATNGQFLAIRAETYDAAGGFAAVRDALGEDAALGRRLVELGFRLRLVDGARLLTCRAYDGVRELWRANVRNLLPVFFGSVALLLAVTVALAALYLAPPVLLAWALVASRPAHLPPAALALAEVGLGIVSRRLADRRAGYPAWLSALHALAMAALAGMTLGSLVRWRWRRRVEWRGRRYEVGDRTA